MIEKEKILNMIFEILKEIAEETENVELEKASLNTPLYGKNGNIDSLSLVRLIAELEEKVHDNFDKELVLADERAMSAKFSPFRSVASLADHVLRIIE